MSSVANQFDFDVAVIGGGSAGYAAARTAASSGLRTVVLEGGTEVGGLCILRGCMPSKALLHAAEVLHLVRHAGVWGIQAKGSGFDFAQVMARKERLIREFAEYRHQQLDSGRFKFLRARGSFLDAQTLGLGNGRTLTANHFVIATGSTPAPPPLPHLREIGYLTSDDALSLTRLPRSLVVLGGGAIAVELAQFFARFDVKVTLIQRSERILRDFDTDAATELEKVLRREGITLYCRTQLTGASRKNAKKTISFLCDGQPAQVVADEILVALGRVPNTAALELSNAGVLLNEGRVVTNDRMQTNLPHIYAAGDCAGPHDIVHIAIQQGEIAAHNIAHAATPRSMDYRLLTKVIFTEPQLASVGLTEKEAQASQIAYRAASYPFRDHGKSMILERLDGFVKLLADPASGEILGGGVVGPLGGELIHEIVAAMAKRMTVRELAALPHYHPTLAEIWTYPAEELAQTGSQE